MEVNLSEKGHLTVSYSVGNPRRLQDVRSYGTPSSKRGQIQGFLTTIYNHTNDRGFREGCALESMRKLKKTLEFLGYPRHTIKRAFFRTKALRPNPEESDNVRRLGAPYIWDEVSRCTAPMGKVGNRYDDL